MKIQVKILAVLMFLTACAAVIACGGSSDTASPNTVYLSDGFEGGGGSGWFATLVTGSTYNWTIVDSGTTPPAAPHGGSNMALFDSYTAPAGDKARLYHNSGFLIPDSVTAVTLTFFLYQQNTYSGDQIQVQVSTDGGTNWINVGPAISTYDTTTAHWQQHTVDLTPYKGYPDVILGFLAISGFGYSIYLDDVLVTATN
jgi:hypothetical protein